MTDRAHDPSPSTGPASGPGGKRTTERPSIFRKYRSLSERYRRLVRRYQADRLEGTAGLSVIRALRESRTALALVREGEFLVRSARWLELDLARGPDWLLVPSGMPARGGERAYPGLGVLALGECGPFVRSGARSSERRFVRVETGQAMDVWLERIESLGPPPVVLFLAHDVTARLRSQREEALARRQRSERDRIRRMGWLASSLAADVDAMLREISVRVALLERNPAVRAAEGRVVESIAQRLRTLSERLGHLEGMQRPVDSRGSVGCDLGAVVTGAVESIQPRLAAAEHAPEIRVELGALPPVRGNAADVREVFSMLVQNGADAMPEGGRIRIRGRAENGDVVVTVSDRGRGIPPQDLSRVFEPFFTTKHRRGAGLGLAVAFAVMDRLGGSIHAANRAGGGTVVTLVFPAAQHGREHPLTPAGAPRPGHRVLVVDDDVENLEAARIVLEQLGQEVSVARSGPEALGRIEAGERFDLVLCDVGMPGMSGWEVAEAIRRVAPEVAVHMLTGWAQEIAEDDPNRRLVSSILPKPIELERMEQLFGD